MTKHLGIILALTACTDTAAPDPAPAVDTWQWRVYVHGGCDGELTNTVEEMCAAPSPGDVALPGDVDAAALAALAIEECSDVQGQLNAPALPPLRICETSDGYRAPWACSASVVSLGRTCD